MSLEIIFMPILTMISGIAALFIDPNDPKIKWAKPLMLSLILISTLATVFFGCQNQEKSKKNR